MKMAGREWYNHLTDRAQCQGSAGVEGAGDVLRHDLVGVVDVQMVKGVLYG